MPAASLAIQFAGEKLVLRADRTLFWPRHNMLLAADLHAGKSEHMRAYGLAIPAGNLSADLARLAAALRATGARRLIFLGDLFHSEPNHEWQLFAAWCHQQAAVVELVKGNHDRFLTSDMLADAGLSVHDEPYTVEPFSLRHHPHAVENKNETPVIAGHLHPVVTFQAIARDRHRLPCFWRQPSQLILPAFGSLTGGYTVPHAARSGLYACSTDHDVIITLSPFADQP